MSVEENKLKAMWSNEPTYSNSDDELSHVLTKAKAVVATRDVASIFVAWVWTTFLGFGASLYCAKRRYEQHQEENKNNTKKHE